jgi:hypothetical protein
VAEVVVAALVVEIELFLSRELAVVAGVVVAALVREVEERVVVGAAVVSVLVEVASLVVARLLCAALDVVEESSNPLSAPDAAP